MSEFIFVLRIVTAVTLCVFVSCCRFYTLLVLSTLLFGKPPFKNVIVNGLVLARSVYLPTLELPKHRHLFCTQMF